MNMFYENHPSSNENEHVETGRQSELTGTILKIAETFRNGVPEILEDVDTYMHQLKPMKSSLPNFRRTADEIVTSGYFSGCHEAGLVRSALYRAKGLDCIYIQCLKREHLEKFRAGAPKTRLSGHVFLRVRSDEGDKIVNSTTGKVTESIPEDYVIGGEGLDSWDIGLNDGLEDLRAMYAKKSVELQRAKN